MPLSYDLAEAFISVQRACRWIASEHQWECGHEHAAVEAVAQLNPKAAELVASLEKPKPVVGQFFHGVMKTQGSRWS